ncbi:MAG: hypothetical protein AAB578_10980 [Elusimicrobiota bacterium]
MPTLNRQGGGSGPLGGYGWVLVVFILGVAFWLSSPLMRQTGSDSVPVPKAEETAGEQSLRSLDESGPGPGSPGESLRMEMPASGGYRRKDAEEPGSSLYQSPSPVQADGAPVGEGTSASAQGAGEGMDSLAAKLKRVSESSSASSRDGWGGQAPRSGFSAPKASFGGFSGSSGGGGSAASLAVTDKPFGLGGAPKLDESGMGAFGGLSGKTPAFKKAPLVAGLGKSLESLKSTERASVQALRGNAERSAGLGSRSFDAALASGRSIGAEGGASHGGVGLGEGGVPANLKANPQGLDKKEIKPPEVKPQPANLGQDKNNMMMMMMMMMVMGGLMGPMGAMMGPMMMMGMSGAA